MARGTATNPYAVTNVGHILAAQQQQSFWGIDQVLQQRRDQIQKTPAAATSSRISGYTSSSMDDDGGVLGYSGQSQKNNPQNDNPLASRLYDQATTETPSNPVWGAWVQGLADWEHDNPLSPADVEHFTTTYTAQAGLDRTQQGVLAADDAFVIGIVASWANTRTGYFASPTTLLMSGPGVGVYTEYVKGGFSTDVTAKFDFLKMDQDFDGTAPNSSVNLTNEGVSGNAQYKFTGNGNDFVEPTVGFSLTHTSFASGGLALGLTDAYTLRLQAGARAGTTWDVGSGVTIDGSLKALVYGDAVAQSTSTTGSSAAIIGSPITPSDTGLVRGEIDPELCFNLPDNYSVTLSGQVRFGQALIGGSGGATLRKQW